MSSVHESYTWTPTSPSSGVGTLDSRGYAYAYTSTDDSNLPEVVPGTSPTLVGNSPLPPAEKEYKARDHDEENNPKFPVIYDNAPKYPGEPQSMSDHLPGSPYTSVPWEPLSAIEEHPPKTPGGKSDGGDERRICGLRQRIFIIVVIIVLVVLAAAIGGGVGSSMAAKSRESSGNGTASTSGSSTKTPSSTSTTSTTTTTSASPTATFLNNVTGAGTDGFQFQAFLDPKYLGNASAIITEEGFTDLGMQAHSYVWLPNNTGCCVTFCQNLTYAGGWWCQQRYQQNASGWFERIYIGCGDDASQANSRCS